jgi:hypothetical protein
MHNETRLEKFRRSPDVQPSDKTKPNGKRNRRLLLALLLLMPIVMLLLLVCLAVEREPVVIETAVPTVDSALRARNLAKVVLWNLNSHRETASISASEDDLNAMMTLAARGANRFSGRVKITPGILFLMASVRLPDNPLGRYLNMRVELLPDERGLNINRVKVGKLGIPRLLSVGLLRRILDLGMGNSEGTALLGSVQSVTMTMDMVTVNLRSVSQLKERLSRLQVFLVNLHEMSNGGSLSGDQAAVSRYYMQLMEAERLVPAGPPLSLAAYLEPLFRLARERSATGDPVRENRAALLALAIYLGDHRFEKLAGLQLKPEAQGRSSFARAVHLGGRRDLCLHFVISAGLKVLTDQGISTAVGEFKELLDARKGGSGFSFTDLAADSAGIRFAETAADTSGGAASLQNLLARGPGEQLFFPDVAGLPENIPRDEFERQYVGVNSPAYDRMVNEINRRINECPAYKGNLR